MSETKWTVKMVEERFTEVILTLKKLPSDNKKLKILLI